MMHTLGELLKWVVVLVAAPLAWYMTFWLRGRSKRIPTNRVLRFQVLAMGALAILATVFAVVFVQNDWPNPPLDLDSTRVLTRGATASLVIGTALYCRWLYRGNRGGQPPTKPV